MLDRSTPISFMTAICPDCGKAEVSDTVHKVTHLLFWPRVQLQGEDFCVHPRKPVSYLTQSPGA